MGGRDVDPSEALLRKSDELLALCDCNNFFVSCERLFRPDLENRPVVVLSSNDGVVISRSNEVKAMGVKMGEPYFRVAPLLARRGVTVFSSNFRLYEEVSDRVMEILARFSPSREVYSIDEAFLEVPSGEGERWGRAVRSAVYREMGIPLSVGAAPVKVLAKLAADRAKKGDGVLVLPVGRTMEEFLDSFPVRDVWGVGRQMEKLLRGRGITTALRLRNAPDEWVERRLGITGLRIVWELRGVRCFPVEERESPRKSIQSSRSFSAPVRDLESMTGAVTEFAMIAARRLRAQKAVAGRVMVGVVSGGFGPLRRRRQAERLLDPPTDSDITIVREATEGLRSCYRDGEAYEKAEILLTALSSSEHRQMGLFQQHDERGAALARVTDRLNAEAGRKILQPAILMGEKPWRSRRAMCSSVSLENMDFLPLLRGKDRV